MKTSPTSGSVHEMPSSRSPSPASYRSPSTGGPVEATLYIANHRRSSSTGGGRAWSDEEVSSGIRQLERCKHVDLQGM